MKVIENVCEREGTIKRNVEGGRVKGTDREGERVLPISVCVCINCTEYMCV